MIMKFDELVAEEEKRSFMIPYKERVKIVTKKTNNGKIEFHYDKSSGKLENKQIFFNNTHIHEEYDDQGNITSKSLHERNDKGMSVHTKDEVLGKSGYMPKSETWWEYDENGNETLCKHVENGDESQATITKRKYNDAGVCIYYARKDPGKKWIERKHTFDETGFPRQVDGAKLAKKYNELYDGIFLHSCDRASIENLMQMIRDGSRGEICVSSMRSNTTIRGSSADASWEAKPNDTVEFIGFGEFKELHPIDVWSYQDESGRRLSYQDEDMAVYQPSLYKDLHKSIKKLYNKKSFYDEGYVPANTIDLVIAAIPPMTESGAEKQGRRALIAQIKKYIPHIQIMSFPQLGQLLSSGKLLEAAYEARDKKHAAESMEIPMHKYEESRMLTFEEFSKVLL